MPTYVEIAVIVKGQRIGYVDEEAAREMVRSGGYTVISRRKPSSERAIKLVEETAEAVNKARALCNSSQRAALSTTQREELYSGFRRPGHGQTPSDGPVTATITVVRKYRAGIGFVPWGEKDMFTRRRFNPDKIPVARFQSEAAYRAAQAGNAAVSR